MAVNEGMKFLLEMINCHTFNWSINKKSYEKCVFLIIDKFAQLGFSTEIIETQSGPAIIGFKEGKKKKHLHFNGHYDVVPMIDNQTITSNNSLNSKAKVIYGRGSSDMKGGIVSIWLAMKELINNNKYPSLSFSFSPDEELGGNIGSKLLVEKVKTLLPVPDLIIIADSSYPYLLTGHRGALWLQVSCETKKNYRFNCSSKCSSAFMLACLISPLIEKEIKNYNIFDSFFGGNCTSSSSATNIVSQKFSFSIDIRFSDNKITKNIKNRLISSIKQAVSKFETDGYIISIKDKLFIPTCPDAEIPSFVFNTVKKFIPNCTYGIGKGYYDLRFFRNQFSCPSFILGPGTSEQAHTAEEFIIIKNITDCAKVYTALINNGC